MMLGPSSCSASVFFLLQFFFASVSRRNTDAATTTTGSRGYINPLNRANRVSDFFTSHKEPVVSDASFKETGEALSCHAGNDHNDSNFPVGDEKLALFSEEEHGAFHRDGFLVVSNLLEKAMLSDLITAGNDYMNQSNKMKSYFSSIEMGMIFSGGKELNRTVANAFRKVALESVLPQAAAELMRLGPMQNVRVLRDVFMSKAVDFDDTCDWHVDDIGFWPEAFGGCKEGVNAWIALEDMPREFQGSMALSPGSHKAAWKTDAYASIGLNLTFQGGFTKEEVTEMAKAGKKLLNTCDMKTQGPEIRKIIEATKWIPDIKKGDVIFATRSLFHRTVPVTPEGKQFYAKMGIKYLNRYSVRYVPGSARLPHGWTFEWSIMSNSENEGSTLDFAMEERENLLWYPRVWPSTDIAMADRLDYLARTELEEMKARAKMELYELFALFPPKKQS